MKLFRRSLFAVLSIGMIACTSAVEDAAEDSMEELSDSMDELGEELGESAWKSDGDGEFYEIDVPGRMYVRSDLNTDASLQYAYVEETATEVKEHYLVVLSEAKSDIEADLAEMDMEMDIDVMQYRDICVEGLANGLDTYSVLTEEPVIETVNGMDCVKNEMRGSKGSVNVYYQLGVFEGEKGFYQVLSWCIEEQKEEFVSDMEQIIDSFKEI
ncbi:MAG: hypothetical protein MI810_09175 [Flavobacteriales bacterium]|nr:hypothetical protein [Flavobacteriales bacterium]